MRASVVVELDYQCGHPACADKGTYALVGVCGNCGRDARVIFTKGHATPSYAGGPACWNCGCRNWSWRRQAGAGVGE